MVVEERLPKLSKMPSRVGVNLRASAYLHQGDRKYMEDEFVVAYQRTADKKDIEYAFFGIFDGHGGKEAAHFAKDHLMDNIVTQRSFWSDDDNDVLDAIREGFIQTHMAMWKVLEKWPLTASGWPSTSGSTASVAFIRKQKIYIGHVGDSGICLGYENSNGYWVGEHLTKDHKPESNQEKSRITRCGGKVVNKSGVPRVVWNRPKRGHKGPVRRSTPMDEIPFLAVARSLGDLWSYNPTNNQFVVSPVPDVHVHPIDIKRHRCLIFGTDGLWNVMSPSMAVNIAYHTELNNENHYLGLVMPCGTQHMWVNPSRSVVKGALDRYSRCNLRADNTSAVVVFLDPPGRPKREVLLQRKGLGSPSTVTAQDTAVNTTASPSASPTKDLNCKVQVHVYNLDNNKATKPAEERTPHGLLRITERLPQKWQSDPNTGESSQERATPRPTPIVIGISDENEQAPTPGAAQLGLRRPSSGSSLMASPSFSTKASSLSSIPTSTISRLTPLPLKSSPISTSLPSLRSSGRFGSSDLAASPLAVSSQSSRLSLCTKCSPKKSSPIVARKPAAESASSVNDGECPSDWTTASSVSGRAIKRERDDDGSEECVHVKKTCTECKCNDQISHPPQDHRDDRTSSGPVPSSLSSDHSRSSNVSSHSSLTSSPKSLKLKTSSQASQENSKVNRKRDDIQIPVISSSTSVSCKTSSVISAATTEGDAGNKFKLKKCPRHCSGDVVKVQLVKHRTRSSVAAKPATETVSNAPSRASPSHDTETKASSSRTPGDVDIKNPQNRLTSSATMSRLPCDPAAASSRVLKSVNRGSPNESKLPLKSHSSSSLKSSTSLRSSKYGKKKRNLTVPSLGSDGSTAPPPKKKWAAMHLRSGKPMVTRSQEKGCKSVNK